MDISCIIARMLTIRLQRVGRKNDPSFRVVLMEAKRAAQSGKVNEILGSYNTRQKKAVLKRDRIDFWASKGATMSATVRDLLRREPSLKK